jgi:hypothetical protein
MPRKCDDTEWLTLRDGPSIPAPVIDLLFRLQEHGISVTRRADRLRITPASALTSADRAALMHWRPYVFALVQYLERDDLDAHLRSGVH